jgi:hypothetical protein
VGFTARILRGFRYGYYRSLARCSVPVHRLASTLKDATATQRYIAGDALAKRKVIDLI